MKRKIISTVLTLVLCFIVAIPAFAAEVVNKTSVRIPGCNAIFTLENVNSEYGVTQGDVPEYFFAFPGTEGNMTCDTPATVETYGEFKADDPAKSNAGGGFPLFEANWSREYIFKDDGPGKGITFDTVFVLKDGSLSVSDEPLYSGEEYAAKITFVMGYPIPYGYSNKTQLPENLIREDAELRPITEFAIADAPPPPTSPTITATPTASTVLVNGENIAFDAYNIGGNNYFKLRDLAYTLSGTDKQFEVDFDGSIILTSGQAYTEVGGEMTGKGTGAKTATPTTSKIYLDTKEVQLTAYNIEGNNYFKLRDIGAAFDFGVTWDGTKNTIVIDTSIGYTPEGAVTPPPTTTPTVSADFLSNKICQEIREYALSLGFEKVTDYTDSAGGWIINIWHPSAGQCTNVGFRLAADSDYWIYGIEAEGSYAAAVERGRAYNIDEMKTIILRCANYTWDGTWA